jgi:hypothetical protein
MSGLRVYQDLLFELMPATAQHPLFCIIVSRFRVKAKGTMMLGNLPGIGFFVATCFAALAIVSGAGLIFIEYRDHTNQFLGPAVMSAVGIALLVLAFFAEKRGRGHKIFVGLRNSILVLFGIVLLVLLAFLLIRPFH